MKFVFIFLLLVAQSSFAQNLVGYTFSNNNKQTPFELTLAPFSTDGCTRYDDGPSDNPTKWQHCCVAHDAAYWLGGTKEERLKADQDLRACVAETGHTGEARVMYAGTRAGGGPLGQNTYRWGFGWSRVRDYHVLTAQEKEMAHAMYGEDLVTLKKDISEHKFPIVVPETYNYVSPFPYTFCEEEIINHLSPLLTKSATVTKFRDYQVGSAYMISIGLDICNESVEYQFNSKTDSKSCKQDYSASKVANKIVDVRISNQCLKRIKNL